MRAQLITSERNLKTAMAHVIINEPMGQKKPSNGLLMRNFADSLGVSLEELGKEYDDMITNFELQKTHLKSYTPSEDAIFEERKRSRSPTPSTSSQNSLRKEGKKRTFSTSIRTARNTLRRKLSSKSRAPHHEFEISPRKDNRSSVSSFRDSETSSMDHESENHR